MHGIVAANADARSGRSGKAGKHGDGRREKCGIVKKCKNPANFEENEPSAGEKSEFLRQKMPDAGEDDEKKCRCKEKNGKNDFVDSRL